MSLIRSTDKLVEGLNNKFFTEQRASDVATPLVEAEAARAEGVEQELDGRLDVIEGSGEGSIAKAEQDAKDYADQKVADLINGAPAMLDTLKEIADQLENDESVVSALTNTVAENLQTAKDYADAQVSSEQSARESADSLLSGRLDSLELDSVTKTYVDAEVSGEETRAMSAESALSGRLDSLESDPTTKSYVDSQDSGLQGQINTEKERIDAILLASQADKDSFAEIVSLINSVDTENDNAFASYVLSNDAALAQEVSDREAAVSSEESARQAADELLLPLDGSRSMEAGLNMGQNSLFNMDALGDGDGEFSIHDVTHVNNRFHATGNGYLDSFMMKGQSTVRARMYHSYTEVTGSYTIPASAEDTECSNLFMVTTLGGNITIKLPRYLGGGFGDGQMLTIKDCTGQCSQSKKITIVKADQDSAAVKVEGGSSYVLDTAYESITIVAAGGSWFIL